MEKSKRASEPGCQLTEENFGPKTQSSSTQIEFSNYESAGGSTYFLILGNVSVDPISDFSEVAELDLGILPYGALEKVL